MLRCLLIAIIALTSAPAFAQENSKQTITEAFGVTLGANGTLLETKGFVRADPIGKDDYSSWYSYAHDFFDQISAHAVPGSNLVSSVSATLYYRDVKPFVDLAACERPLEGLVETIHRRYPTLKVQDDSAAWLRDGVYKHVKAIIFSPSLPDWSQHRTILVMCHSGMIGGDSPKPVLKVRYSLSMPEIRTITQLAKARDRQKAQKELETQGLKIEDF